jgi:hypothetical protein
VHRTAAFGRHSLVHRHSNNNCVLSNTAFGDNFKVNPVTVNTVPVLENDVMSQGGEVLANRQVTKTTHVSDATARSLEETGDVSKQRIEHRNNNSTNKKCNDIVAKMARTIIRCKMKKINKRELLKRTVHESRRTGISDG